MHRLAKNTKRLIENGLYFCKSYDRQFSLFVEQVNGKIVLIF